MGLLDNVFVPLAKNMIDLFVDNTSNLTRIVTVYDELANTESETTTVVSVKTSPPYPYDSRMIDNNTIIAGDVRALVSEQSLVDAGMTIVFNSETKYFLTVGGVNYSVLDAKRYASGDEVAVTELHLRS